MLRLKLCTCPENSHYRATNVTICTGNWSDGLREIIHYCYCHYNLDPETYIQQDPDRNSHERSIIPKELRPQPPPSDSPATRLLPDPRTRKRVRQTANEDEIEEEEDGIEKEQERRQRKKQKSSYYDPFSDDPTPLAIRRCRRRCN